METLKPREKKILSFMKHEISKKGYPPTVREICTALNIKSTSTVHKDIERLEEKGWLKKDPSKPRALMLTERATIPHDSRTNASAERIDVVDVPIVGRIAAGSPILADENIEESFPIPAAYAKGTNFMLTVHGDSMVEAGIFNGDLVLVRQQETANNGDIVVAMLDGLESEATVKTFYKEDGHFRLQPENSSLPPIIVDQVSILGLVKGVFRYLN
ncbi:MAG: transcriptional repressor LexA [Clostridiales Family XIII bacterium]|jgi:repressor LexA|nr:transcriptional repressor LexA [Clostridiales Family XIII bacterium]